MKKLNLIYILLILFLIDCSANKISDFILKLDDSVKNGEISVEEREVFIARYNEGKIAYNLNCASCHTVKKSLPHFTSQQLETYTIRTINKQHSKNLSAENLSEDKLFKIFYFLENNK
ncbi:hypothetical protein GSF70_05435 [Flavobacteriaceae bacterium W22]|nr:hypothetical protein [Flavobacteriaceae bacterium W22]